MEKSKLLKEYIKTQIRTILVEEKNKKDKAKKEQLKSLARIGLICMKFPKLKKQLEELMSPSFAYYIKNITIISPKPTTFRVVLNNDIDFEMIYVKKTFIAKVAGKKYYLLNLGDSERASQAISNQLSLSPQPKEQQNENEGGAPGGGGPGGGGSGPGGSPGLAGDLSAIGGGAGSASGLPELQPEQIPTTDVPPPGGAPGEEAPLPDEEEEKTPNL